MGSVLGFVLLSGSWLRLKYKKTNCTDVRKTGSRKITFYLQVNLYLFVPGSLMPVLCSRLFDANAMMLPFYCRLYNAGSLMPDISNVLAA